jgi:regulator of sirC expression with transglutaminase-like and TPR domain
MALQKSSILSLLADEDTETAALVQAQLKNPSALPELRQLSEESTGLASERLRQVIVEIELELNEQRFCELCMQMNEGHSMEDAAWLLANVLLPGEDFSAFKAELDTWGKEVKRRLHNHTNVEEQAAVLAHYIGNELGFHGNEENYYEKDNSLIPRVIDTRIGIPISLSIIYIAIASRAELHVHGVGLPGHFIVKLGSVYMDPFHHGKKLSLADCQKLMASQNLDLLPHHLQACKPKVFLARMLNNLLHVAEQEDDTRLAAKLQNWLRLLQHGI